MGTKLQINPFKEIWFSPRKTIQAIVEFNPKYYLYFFATVQGLYSLINVLSSFSPISLDSTGGIVFLVVAILISPFIGLFYFWVNSWILKWIGSWFKGKASHKETRTVLAWSQLPVLFLLLIYAINQLILYLCIDNAVAESMPLSAVIAQYPVWLFISSALTAVFGIWSLVIFFGGVAQVHQFGVGKAILTGIIAIIFWWLVLSIILTISALLTSFVMGL